MCSISRVQHWSTGYWFLSFTNFVFDDSNRTYWKMNSSWKDSHRAQIAYRFKTEALIQYCNKSRLWFCVKNPKQWILRPDVNCNQSEMFHFCILTSVIGKTLDVQNRNTFTYIRWRSFKSRITNIRLSLCFLHWKEHNEFHLSFHNGIRNSYFSHNGWNSPRSCCVSRKKVHGAKSGIYQNDIFVSCFTIKLKLNRLNRLKAKNRRIYTNLANSFFRSRLFSTELPIAQISDKNFVPFHRLQI